MAGCPHAVRTHRSAWRGTALRRGAVQHNARSDAFAAST